MEDQHHRIMNDTNDVVNEETVVNDENIPQKSTEHNIGEGLKE